MIFRKLGALQVLDKYKLSYELVDAFEESLRNYNDNPEDYQPKRLLNQVTKHRRRRDGSSYQGKTPRTNLGRSRPFDRIVDLHDEYAKNNTTYAGIFGFGDSRNY